MRKFVPYVFAAVAGLVAVVPAGAAEHPGKPGKWSISTQMEMPGLPIKMPPIKYEMCLTEEDMKDPQKSVPNDPKSDCKVGNYKLDGNTMSWTFECPKQKTKGEGTVTYTDDHESYTGTMHMKAGEQEMSAKYSAKWLGACTK